MMKKIQVFPITVLSSCHWWILFQSHQHKQRVNHQPKEISVPVEYKQFYREQKAKYSKSLTIQREKMELFAVICIQTSHYVSFVKTGIPKNGKKAEWIFFDSMADRMGMSCFHLKRINLLKSSSYHIFKGRLLLGTRISFFINWSIFKWGVLIRERIDS